MSRTSDLTDLDLLQIEIDTLGCSPGGVLFAVGVGGPRIDYFNRTMAKALQVDPPRQALHA
jgi:hypothetical protein